MVKTLLISFLVWSGLFVGFCLMYNYVGEVPKTPVVANRIPVPGLESTEEFYASGATKSKGQMQNGKSHGIWYYYHENGQLYVSGEMKDGRPEGVWDYYHDNGKLQESIFYLEGERHGMVASFDDKGNKLSETNYQKGSLEGSYKEYYTNGNKRFEGQYKFDKKVDLWYYRATSGEVEQTFNYDSTGKMISFQQYKKGKKTDLITYDPDSNNPSWWKYHKEVEKK